MGKEIKSKIKSTTFYSYQLMKINILYVHISEMRNIILTLFLVLRNIFHGISKIVLFHTKTLEI